MTPNLPQTAELDDYNCGGFALSTFDIVAPYDDDDYDENLRIDTAIALMDRFESTRIVEDIIAEIDAEYLLLRYPFLQRITSREADLMVQNESKYKPTIIAYRVFFKFRRTDDGFRVDDSDFHFKVYLKGQWYEKRGSSEVEKCTRCALKPWYYEEDTIYTSKIIYFIDKGGKRERRY